MKVFVEWRRGDWYLWRKSPPPPRATQPKQHTVLCLIHITYLKINSIQNEQQQSKYLVSLMQR